MVENIGEGTFRNMDESQTKTAGIVSNMWEAFPRGCRFPRFEVPGAFGSLKAFFLFFFFSVSYLADSY